MIGWLLLCVFVLVVAGIVTATIIGRLNEILVLLKDSRSSGRSEYVDVTKQVASLNTWRRVQGLDEESIRHAAKSVFNNADALSRAVEIILSTALPQEEAAAKVIRDNNPLTDLPTVTPKDL